jgi:hypothetical protein
MLFFQSAHFVAHLYIFVRKVLIKGRAADGLLADEHLYAMVAKRTPFSSQNGAFTIFKQHITVCGGLSIANEIRV